MTTEIMKIVITGNVDHGKSTFIGRLYYDTGSLPPDKMAAIQAVCDAKGMLDVEFAFVTDHLEEEREQALTIDTAQTFFATPRRRYTIIDAPGHKEFMKNMMTGASQAEASVLIVDAREGVCEQTRRHAYILGMFNLGRCIVVLNKMDLVGYGESAFSTLRAEVLALLKQHGITPAHVIPASAKMGDNFVALSPRIP
ncbi:MAG: GTP-binding protein [Planctomycetota bacterium]